MPEPNPNQDFTDRLMGNPLFRAGAALTGDLPQFLGQQQRGQIERDRTELLRQQLERQNSLADLQIFQGTVDSIPKFQRFLQMIPDEKARAEAAAEYGVFFSKLLQRVGRADKEATALSTPSAIASALLSTTSADALIKNLEFLSPEERRHLIPMFNTGNVGDASQAWELAGKMNEKAQERILTGLGNRIAGMPKAGPVSAEIALQQAQATPEERKVVANLPNRLAPDRLANLYRQYGIIPPETGVKIAEKEQEITGLTPAEAKKAAAIDVAKQQTPGGQAQIGLQRAQTLAAQTPTVVPLQPESGVAVMPKGPGGEPQMVMPPVAQTKLSPQERTVLSEEQAALERFDKMAGLYHPSFVGPVRGRLGTLGQKTGVTGSREAEFRSQVAEFRNSAIKQISGAAVTPQEAKRMEEQLPNADDPSVVFEGKLRQTRRNLHNLAKIRRKTLEQTGANIKNLPPLQNSPDDPLGIR